MRGRSSGGSAAIVSTCTRDAIETLHRRLPAHLPAHLPTCPPAHLPAHLHACATGRATATDRIGSRAHDDRIRHARVDEGREGG
eukprot:2667680-Prymnesium_polylepis.1